MTLTFRLWRKCRAYVETWGMTPEHDDPRQEPLIREAREAAEAKDTRWQHDVRIRRRAVRHLGLREEVDRRAFSQ